MAKRVVDVLKALGLDLEAEVPQRVKAKLRNELGLLRMQDQVREFHKKFGHPAPESLDPEEFEKVRELRISLIEEEAKEFSVAARSGDVVETVDALCDLLYVTFGAAVSLGVDLTPFFDEVHQTNMAKVGGPTRGDGKVLKPEGWEPPRIGVLLYNLYGY